MGAVRSSLTLNDGMTPTLRKINRAMGLMLNNFEAVQRASGQSVNTGWINDTRHEIGRANAALDEMEENYRRCNSQQARLNDTISEGASKAEGLMNKIKGVVGVYAGIQGLKALGGLSDAQAQTTARLNLLVTDGGSVAELKKKINASAMRSRSAYLDTAAAGSKLGLNAGNAFNHDMNQVIAFMEQVNKQFVIGGATAQEQSSAMIQLTQAMAAGTLRGEELNSILDGAPGIARAIERYMGAAEGSIKGLAEEGKVTAQVVKNAMFATANETNAKFERMPLTWGQVWTMAGNIGLQALNPILQAINWLANNLAVIGPLVLGLGGAFLVFQLAAHWTQIAAFFTGAYNAVVNFLSIGFGVLSGSTAAASAAQFTYNSALLACPLTWIILLIIVLIAIIYAVIGAINKFAGTSISATGAIFGAFAVLGAAIWNIIVGVINALIQFLWTYFVEPWIGIIEFVLNVFNGGFNSFGDGVKNLLGQIISWFLSLGKVVTKIIDAIFGTNWTAGLSSLQDNVLSWGKNENAITLSREAPTLQSLTGGKVDRWAYSDAWNTGYTAGESVENAVAGMLNTDQFANMSNTLGDISDDTSSLSSSSDKTTEELAYLRDIAEKEAINRFTTAEVKIDMTGMTNRIDGGMDIDGVVNKLTEEFVDALSTAAEGVHE